jgi:hypothetical protein
MITLVISCKLLINYANMQPIAILSIHRSATRNKNNDKTDKRSSNSKFDAHSQHSLLLKCAAILAIEK